MKQTCLFLAALFALLLSSCGLEIKPDDNLRIVKRAVPHYKTEQSVSIHNYYEIPTLVESPLRISGDKIDLQQYTEAAIKLVNQGMSYQNIIVDPSSDKIIKIRVYDLKWGSKKGASIWDRLGVSLELTAELSNGNVINIYHFKHKQGTFSRTYNRAINSATEKLLNHPDFIKFMNG